MTKRCPNCKGTALKLLFIFPDQQGSAYWTCLQCSWAKFIPWWNRKRYIKLEKKLELRNQLQPEIKKTIDKSIDDMIVHLKADPAVKDIDEKN